MWISKIIKSKIFLIAACAFLCSDLYGQSDSLSIKVYFNQGSHSLSDMRAIDQLDLAIESIKQDTLREITNISIEGFSSPEGSPTRNNELSLQRAEAIKSYLIDRGNIPDSLITICAGGVAWDEFENILNRKGDPEATKLELTIKSTPVAQREERIEKMDSGDQYQYLFDNIYPRLRYSNVMILSHRLETIVTPAHATQEIEVGEREDEAITTLETPQSSKSISPLFALKTNLLFDLATLINLEVEVPIRERWSVCAEFIFPWWTMHNGLASSRRNRIQLLNGNLELRRWWHNSDSPILTGWFCGAYASVGSYDFEWRAKGYQGEWFAGAGLSGGYSHTINQAENLRLEYSLGVGYFETDYTYYHAEFCNNSCWHALEQRSGRHTWVGPTRAKVSLSWLIN